MILVPVSQRQAAAFVARHHRHSKPPRGSKFQIGLADESGELLAVAIAGRPVARSFDDGFTLEVTRVCAAGEVRNANSMLYGACARAAFALGFRRLITYTLRLESGASLRGAGWKIVAERAARPGWSAPSRPRDPLETDGQPKLLWEATG